MCAQLHATGNEVSKVKSKAVASLRSLAEKIAKRLSRFGITVETKVKSLGLGMAAGRRRNARVAAARLKAFQDRKGAFRKVRKAGLKPRSVLATGGTAAKKLFKNIISMA